MAQVKQLQGESCHLEYLKCNDGVRRHPAHCIYARGVGKNRTCTCKRNPKYNQTCRSSKHCDDYLEK